MDGRSGSGGKVTGPQQDHKPNPAPPFGQTLEGRVERAHGSFWGLPK